MYGYAYGNPTTYIDPTGESALGIGVVVVGGVVVYTGFAGIYASGRAYQTFPAKQDDKKRHCYASCLLNKLTLWTYGPAWLAGTSFEYFQKLGGPGYFDEKDLEANAQGLAASYSQDCEKACTTCQPQ